MDDPPKDVGCCNAIQGSASRRQASEIDYRQPALGCIPGFHNHLDGAVEKQGCASTGKGDAQPGNQGAQANVVLTVLDWVAGLYAGMDPLHGSLLQTSSIKDDLRKLPAKTNGVLRLPTSRAAICYLIVYQNNHKQLTKKLTASRIISVVILCPTPS
jgi:hypothetical protein